MTSRFREDIKIRLLLKVTTNHLCGKLHKPQIACQSNFEKVKHKFLHKQIELKLTEMWLSRKKKRIAEGEILKIRQITADSHADRSTCTFTVLIEPQFSRYKRSTWLKFLSFKKTRKAKGVTFLSSKTKTRKEMQDAPQPKCKVEKKLFQPKRSNNLSNHAQGGGGGEKG